MNGHCIHQAISPGVIALANKRRYSPLQRSTSLAYQCLTVVLFRLVHFLKLENGDQDLLVNNIFPNETAVIHRIDVELVL